MLFSADKESQTRFLICCIRNAEGGKVSYVLSQYGHLHSAAPNHDPNSLCKSTGRGSLRRWASCPRAPRKFSGFPINWHVSNLFYLSTRLDETSCLQKPLAMPTEDSDSHTLPIVQSDMSAC